MSLRPGKLPAALLASLLERIPHADARVLVGPGIGRDAAVIDIGGGRVLVAKTDPVTMASDLIGWYAVHVNANDIACMGARPAWFLATALLPPGEPETLPAIIFDQLIDACAGLGIELVGGHCEVTPGIDRPIIAGAMLGEAAREDIVAGEGVREGDVVLLTRGIAIEGTAVLAREAAERLRGLGVSDADIEGAAAMLLTPGISVVAAARALTSTVRPRAMHDPTEGGLLTALEELTHVAGAALHVDAASVRVMPETRIICEAAGLDPWGLLASGALLAIVAPDDAERAIDALGGAGIDCQRIAAVGAGAPRVILGAGDSAPDHPSFERDELARFFDEAREGHRGAAAPQEGS